MPKFYQAPIYTDGQLEEMDDKVALKFSLEEINIDDVLLELINTYRIEDLKINDISIEDIAKNLYEKNEKDLA